MMDVIFISFCIFACLYSVAMVAFFDDDVSRIRSGE